MSPLTYGEGGYGEDVYPGSDSGDSGDGDGTQSPYGGTPATIPGRIEAEHFDVGGEGVAYHETDATASWSLDFRPGTTVDFKTAPGTTDGISVGRFRPAEWLEYTVTAESGVYEIDVRCGTDNPDAAVELLLDGESLATLSVPQTGWSAHEVVTATDVGIESSAAEHTLRLTTTASDADVDWVEFTKTSELMTQTATVTVTLEEQGELTVAVEDQDTNPVEAATVILSGGASDEATTGTDGQVTFGGLEVADYTVDVSKKGYFRQSVDVPAGDFS